MNRPVLAISAIVIGGALWVFVGCSESPEGQPTKWPDSLIGSWQVTRAQTSLILSVEPDYEVLVLWIRPGSHSMQRTSWVAVPRGIMVQSVPRIRLWPGREGRDNELRAELEAIPEWGFDPNEDFHDHFFMGRIRQEEMPQPWLTRPIPERWKMEVLGEQWNTTAGREPLPENIKDLEKSAADDVQTALPEQ